VGEPDFAALRGILAEGGFVSAGTPWPQPSETEMHELLGPDYVLEEDDLKIAV
jgi:hypothetical protein